MRCVDVARELAVPTGTLEPVALESHLASCPTCADHAERASRLDRLWEASRPHSPDEKAWDRLWSRVLRAADSRQDPGVLPYSPSRARQWWAMAAVASLAQAAAFLVAGTLLRPTIVAAAPVYDFEIEVGQTLFLVVDESGDHVVCKPRLHETSDLVAAFDDGDNSEPISVAMWDMEMLNGMESLELKKANQ